MPELPDLEDYRVALAARCLGRTLLGVRIRSVSLLRTVDPAPDAAVGRACSSVERLGKRLVFGFPDPMGSACDPGEADPRDDGQPGAAGDVSGDGAGGVHGDQTIFFVLHLMVAGRLAFAAPGAAIPGRIGLAAFDISDSDGVTPAGTLLLREAGTVKRASLHVVRGRDALAAHDRGGIEPLDADLEAFRAALVLENRTLKRALTDPRRFAGIGNAYSDEILHRARLSPVQRTQHLADSEVVRLHEATRSVLTQWTDRLRRETGDGFPTNVTAFRDDFAVHGRAGTPCPVCDTEVQRIRYASNETNYCPRCQTDGRLLADRGLSRLLRDDWPRTIDEREGD